MTGGRPSLALVLVLVLLLVLLLVLFVSDLELPAQNSLLDELGVVVALANFLAGIGLHDGNTWMEYISVQSLCHYILQPLRLE